MGIFDILAGSFPEIVQFFIILLISDLVKHEKGYSQLEGHIQNLVPSITMPNAFCAGS